MQLSYQLIGLSLFGVFVVARVLALVGRDVPLSIWSPAAYLWQDMLFVLLFSLEARLTRRHPWISRSLYSGTAVYVAINLPLVRYLSSPLTVPMLRAARGTLADSIRHQLTGENLAWMASILVTAALLPVLLRRLVFTWPSDILSPPVGKSGEPETCRSADLSWAGRARAALRAALRTSGTHGLAHPVCLAAAAAVVVAFGPLASARLDTGGMHRNVFLALIESAFPRIAAQPLEGDWRASPMGPAAGVGQGRQPSGDLSGFRGAARGRNVVLIMLESTGAQYLKPYGAAQDPMPHLTALASEAILFENAYAVYPESIKGLFSVLCSRYPAFDTAPEDCARAATPSLAACLLTAGYRTALFHSGRFAYLGMESVVHDRGFQILADAGDIGGNHQSSFGVDEPATVGRILSWIDSLGAGGKFFVTYLPVAGHHPYDSPGPGPFPGTDDLGRYFNALHYSDSAVEQLLDGLRSRGLYENTLFILAGDHGEAFGQHTGNYGHTLFVYEENIHVPWLMVAPGLKRGPFRVSRPVSLIDAAPTVLDMLGMRVPVGYQGNSQLEAGERMALFYTDYSLGLPGLRDGRWKFIFELGSGRPRLFDLTQDPMEMESLSAQDPERVARYREHLLRWAGAQRDLILRASGADRSQGRFVEAR
jgi:hypothetical protein